MIFAHLDNVITKNIIGFECGTRASFDVRHGADPLWIFLDFDAINYQIPTKEFYLNPTNFYIDTKGLIQKHTSQTLTTTQLS